MNIFAEEILYFFCNRNDGFLEVLIIQRKMIFFSASSTSMMTKIWCAFEFLKADVRPIHMAISSASSRVTLFVYALSCAMTLLSFHI